MKATPEDVAKGSILRDMGRVRRASMKATPEDVAKPRPEVHRLLHRRRASMKATPEDVAKKHLLNAVPGWGPKPQ